MSPKSSPIRLRFERSSTSGRRRGYSPGPSLITIPSPPVPARAAQEHWGGDGGRPVSGAGHSEMARPRWQFTSPSAAGHGPRTTGHRPRTTDHGPQTTDHGPPRTHPPGRAKLAADTSVTRFTRGHFLPAIREIASVQMSAGRHQLSYAVAITRLAPVDVGRSPGPAAAGQFVGSAHRQLCGGQYRNSARLMSERISWPTTNYRVRRGGGGGVGGGREGRERGRGSRVGAGREQRRGGTGSDPSPGVAAAVSRNTRNTDH